MAIPGVTTLIRDRFYSVSRQDAPVGPRIVTIARRSTADGTGGVADLDVVRVTNEADAITAFGSGSDAHRAFVELVTAGAERIFVVPLPSNTVFDHSTGALTSDGTSIFDTAFVAAEAVIPDIIIPSVVAEKVETGTPGLPHQAMTENMASTQIIALHTLATGPTKLELPLSQSQKTLILALRL